jgi:hypothetical protein
MKNLITHTGYKSLDLEMKEYRKKHPVKGFLIDLLGVFVQLFILSLIIGYFYWLFFIS